jgi:hypothetical protein
MKTATTVAQMTVRLMGLILIVLGILFWTGHALTLVPVHMLAGLLLVLALWTLAFLGARAGVPTGLVVLAALWGLLVLVLGVTQGQILTTGPHWLVQILHLLVGVAAIGLAETLGARIKRSEATTMAPA